MLLSTESDRLGGDEAELVRLGRKAGGDAIDVMRLVEIAEIAAEVLRVLGCVPSGAAWRNSTFAIFFARSTINGSK